MEQKKNPNVDISKDRVIYRALGFVFVFTITFIMFSFTFFEKKKSNDKLSLRIDEAEQVENTVREKAPPPPPPPQTLQVVENTEEETHEFESTESDEKEAIDEPTTPEHTADKGEKVNDDELYTGGLDKKVSFRDGEEGLIDFLSENLKYPDVPRDNGIEGVIYVMFEVGKDGHIKNIRTDGKGNKELETEAKRVVALTDGMWIAGEAKMKPVRSICKIPITFQLDEEE